jgi:hypothetical protein
VGVRTPLVAQGVDVVVASGQGDRRQDAALCGYIATDDADSAPADGSGRDARQDSR